MVSAVGTLYYARRDDNRQIKTLETVKEDNETEPLEKDHVEIKREDKKSRLDCL